MTTEIKYAPILIPTLCRADHFVRCVESLKKNSWAQYTDVYIALDYPAKDSHWEGYNKICTYLEGDFSEFCSFHVIKRPCNYGADRNIKELRESIFEKYDRFIRTDDDAEFSPNFLEYMDKNLAFFEDDDEIIAVTGYSYPISWDVSEGSTVLKQNFIAPMWGTGFWRDKYQEIRNEVRGGCLIEGYDNARRSGVLSRMTKACYVDYINMSLRNNAINGKMGNLYDVALRAYTTMFDKYVVMPVESKVRNWGFDGSGMYCGKIESEEGKYAYNYPYYKQVIDATDSFEIVLDSQNANDENRNRMDAFDVRSKSVLLKTKVQQCLYDILGRELFLRLLAFVGK